MSGAASPSPPSVSEADPLQGTMYRTVRSIGAGSMGRVLEAEHIGLRRKVAVKLLTPDLAKDPAFVDRLRLEAQALAAVHHPNVVLVHDHGTTPDGVPFLVMELLHGRTLAALLRERGKLPLPEALHLLGQVVSGLAAIHAAGLVHRDLKPANIFLAEEQDRTVVKLLDLGIVKIADQEQAGGIAPLQYPTKPTEAIGTPRCMAPEQILGRPCDARADVYAAGVLLYLLLSGRDPFHRHRTEVAIFTAHVMEIPPPLSIVASEHFPKAVEEAAARALAKDPVQRFGSIAEFGAALTAGTGGGTTRMPAMARAGAPRQSAQPPRTSPAKTDRIEVMPLAPAPNGTPPARATAPRDATTAILPRALPSAATPAEPSVGPPVLGRSPAPAAPAPASAVPAMSARARFLLSFLVALLGCLLAIVAWKVALNGR